MLRSALQTIAFLCCLLSMAAAQQAPNPTLDPIRQVETNGRQAEREFAAGAVTTARPNGPMLPPYLLGKSSEVTVKMALKNLPASTADLTPYRDFLKKK